MSLVSQRTNLKSLRYGQDRPGGGSSNQPYIKSKIPDNSSSLDRSGGVDFLLRGGTLTPSRAAKDVSRLTQMFFDFKSPNGVLFTAKQNVLSRTGVRTQASGLLLNEGAYLPTSTILQAAGNAFGIHLNKQGLDPTKRTGPDAGQNSLFNLLGLRDPLGLPVYTENLGRIQSEKTNRLVQLKYKKIGPDKIDPTSANATTAGLIGSLVRSGIFSTLLSPFNQISSNPGEILKYGGGPGSILGIGKTILKRYSDTNEGETKAKTAQPEKKSLYGKTPFKNITPTQTSKDGVFTLRNSYLYTNTNDGLNFDKVGNSIFKGRYYVLDAKTIFDKTTSKDNTEISDFRTSLLKEQATGLKKNILSSSPDYKTKNIENRVNLGDPGKRSKDVSSYAKGTGDKLTRDLITAMPLYQSPIANHGGDRNDLVKFSIGIMDNQNPNNRTYIHFRAFLDSMDDNYTAEWNDFRYMGRGEKFYRYNGFTRTINLGWTVAAQSKEELIPMYQKLNFLASSLAPDYSDGGYMRGNLAVITIGGYLFDQPGIINSINYSVPTESPWEIGINDQIDNPSAGTKYGYDTTVKELPHIIRVTGFSFTPIHKFVPKLQKNTYEGTYNNKDGTPLSYSIDGKTQKPAPTISGWGKERFIALATSTGTANNYDKDKNYTFGVKGIVENKSTSQTQPPVNTNAAITDITQATQLVNRRF